MKTEFVDLVMLLKHETDKAILVAKDEDDENSIWLPKSQVEFAIREGARRRLIDLTVLRYFAEEKGLV